MTFGHPLLLLSLLVIPLAVGVYLLAERRRMRYAVTFTNLDVLASVAGGRDLRRYVPPVLFLLALGSLCIAVARPNRATMIPSDRATVILVVDISGSMSAKDVKPSRLEAAQAAVRNFLDTVPPRVRVGLIAFAGEAQVAAAPTTDRQVLRDSVDQLGFFQGYGGTAIGDALAAAVDLAKPAIPGQAQTIADVTPKAGSSLASILFLSDGKQTRGLLEPLEGAQRAKDAGIPVFTIALGTPGGTITRDGYGGGGGAFPGGGGGGGGGGFGGGGRVIPVPPDPATLSAVASLTGGKFFAARSADAVKSAYSHLGSLVGRVPGRREVTNEFLALAAALLLAAGVLSTLWSPRIP
jgi:Ca-activated chloride channel family protein